MHTSNKCFVIHFHVSGEISSGLNKEDYLQCLAFSARKFSEDILESDECFEFEIFVKISIFLLALYCLHLCMNWKKSDFENSENKILVCHETTNGTYNIYE